MSDLPTGTVTILFTDLVGSTAQRDRLGDAAADAVRRLHDDALREAIEAADGRIVKSTGDGVMAAFSGAADAIRAAIGCQRAAKTATRQLEEPFEIRVGVAVGDVELDAGDYFGLPVVTAARLCDAARAGEILVADLVKVLAGSRVDASYTESRAMSLKGISEDIVAHSLEWRTSEIARPPFPLSLRSDDELKFVGRVHEHDVLMDAWKHAQRGERRSVLVSGEPGIGKTRLVSHAARQAYDEGALVLLGVCDEDLGVPYQPFTEALGQYLSMYGLDALARRIGSRAVELEQLLPDAAPGEDDGRSGTGAIDADSARYGLFQAYRSFLETVSADAPVVLVLDDLHWAARPTLLLLKHLLRGGGPYPLLVLGTYRDTELDRRHPLSEMLTELRRSSSTTRLALGGLDDDAVTELCRACDLDDDPALVSRLALETQGNAFFVTEVLHQMSTATTDVDRFAVPEGVKEAVGRRLNALSSDGERLLRVGAVIGPEFDLDIAITASGLDGSAAEAAGDDACGLRLLVEIPDRPRSYRFPHAIVRSAILDELTTNQRIRQHRAVAESLEAANRDPTPVLTDLAHHFCEAAPGGDATKAVYYCRLAAEQALRAAAALEAAAWYERALDVPGPNPAPVVRLDLALAAGKAYNDGGQPLRGLDQFASAFEIAEQLDDLPHQVEAAVEAGSIAATWIGATIEGPVERLRAVRERVAGDAGSEALVIAKLATWYALSDPEMAERYIRDALALCEASDPLVALLPRAVLTNSLMIPRLLDEAFTNLDAVESTARDLSIDEVNDVVHSIRPTYTYTAGQAVKHFQAIETLRQQRLASVIPTFKYVVGAWDAARAVVEGRVDDFRREADQALLLVDFEGTRLVQARTHWSLATATGEGLDVARDLIADLLARSSPATLRLHSVLHAEAELVFGDPVAAHEVLDIYARAPDAYPPALDILTAGGVLIGMAVRLERHDDLRVLQEMLGPYATLMGDALWSWSGAIAHHLGKAASALGDFETADRNFSFALGKHEEFDAPLLIASTHLEHGRSHLARRERDNARSHLDLAGDIAAMCGFGAITEEVARLSR